MRGLRNCRIQTGLRVIIMILDEDFIKKEKAKFTDVKARPKEDFTGMTFGRLTVICRADDYHYPNGRDKSAKWHCICSCEDHNLIDVKHSHLKSGATKSCGCYAKESASQTIKYAIDSGRRPLKDNPTLELNLKDDKHEPYGKFRCYNDDSVEVYFSMRDYDIIKDHAWNIQRVGDYIRVKTTGSKTMFQLFGMHDADHINRNALDNRRENLDGSASRSDQMHNTRIKSNNTSGIKGVRYERDCLSKPWKSKLQHHNKFVLFKYFETKDEAVIARLNAEMQYLDERAWQKELMIQYGLIQKEVC